MIDVQRPPLVGLVLILGAALASCGGDDDCGDPDRPVFEFESGTYTVDDSSARVEIEFAAESESFTITLEDGTVELFTRVTPILRHSSPYP